MVKCLAVRSSIYTFRLCSLVASLKSLINNKKHVVVCLDKKLVCLVKRLVGMRLAWAGAETGVMQQCPAYSWASIIINSQYCQQIIHHTTNS